MKWLSVRSYFVLSEANYSILLIVYFWFLELRNKIEMN